MATIRITKNIQADKQHAKTEVQRLAANLGEELSADYTWNGDRLEFRRSGASGHIEIGDDAVHVEIRLGLLLSPLKNAIESRIVSYLEHMSLEKAPADS